MNITIASRFLPFSHQPGTMFFVPKTTLTVQIFPIRLFFSDLENRLPSFTVDLAFKGPIEHFTCQLDLERGQICVFGETKEGYMRYVLQATQGGIVLKVDKIPNEIQCQHSLSLFSFCLSKGAEWLIPLPLEIMKVDNLQEKLSLGVHKSQEWELIIRRLEMREIFPLWHRLATWIPAHPPLVKGGNFQLLDYCRNNLANKEKILPLFKDFFLAAFEKTFIPRLMDPSYQGILPSSVYERIDPTASALPLFTEAAKLIRSLFFKENPEELTILPHLPLPFHSGRLIGIKTAQGHWIDIEWTKKSLKRLKLTSTSEGKVTLKFPKGVTHCRIKKEHQTIKHSSLNADGQLSLQVQEGDVLDFDRFSK